MDGAYVAGQKHAHDDAVTLFTDYPTNGDSPALNAFAGKTLPILKMHQHHVRQLTAAAERPVPSESPSGAEPALKEGANSFREAQA